MENVNTQAQLYYADKLKTVDARLQHLDAKVNDIDSKLHHIEKDTAVYNVEFISVKTDLADIKSSISWVTRLIIGALVLAVIAVITSTNGIIPL